MKPSALVAAVVLAASALALAACGGDDGDAVDPSTSSSTRASTSTTTVGGTVPDTTPVTVGIICASPEDAAQTVVSAWGADDRAAASRCGADDVLDRLFRTSGAGNSWMFQGCDVTDPTAPVCAYSYEGGAAFLTVSGTDTEGWKATQLEYVAD